MNQTILLRRLLMLALLASPARMFAQASLEDLATGRVPVEEKLSVAERSSQFPDRWYPEDKPNHIPTFFTGVPYIAVKVSRNIFRRENGETLTRVQRHPQMRDSAGRERTEANTGGWNGIDVYSVQVIDPVSHCSFQWSFLADGSSMPAEERVAVVRCAARSAAYIPLDIQEIVIDSKPDPSETASSAHFAGSKDGIAYVGVRNMIGNATKPTTPVGGVEIWYSKEMHLQLRDATINPDGSYGDVEELTDIRRTEPDVQLFYPPLDYAIYTENELRELGQRTVEERDRQKQ